MLIGYTSKYLLKKTRAKAKMNEYNVPANEHISVERGVEDLFLITVATIGNVSADIIRNPTELEQIIKNEKASLEFSSKYFDSYLEAKLDNGFDDYYLILGSIAYYLCDYIGSSKVLIDKIDSNSINIGAHGIENALVSLLKNQFHKKMISNDNNIYSEDLIVLQDMICEFWANGCFPDITKVNSFRNKIYQYGSDIELLLGDAFCAIYLLKIQRSLINLLPKYMRLDIDVIKNLVFNKNQIKELWPSQRRIGEANILNGTSAVIQMPTSSGKTKSISLIIASAFLSERTNLAIVVAPFRALCREISIDLSVYFEYDKTIHIDELSDVLQNDIYKINFYGGNQKSIIVSTPEKLIYLLRQRNDFIDKAGLVIFDEGHLFDDRTRGITYELLISTIKNVMGNNIQKVLVSAIIPNSEEINEWLNNGKGVFISDNTIKSTQKTIAMTDWAKQGQINYGYLYFLNPENPEEEEFYVPRLIRVVELNKKGKERKKRNFPEIDYKNRRVLNNDIAIYYGLKLCKNGGVGIFSGKRESVNSILGRFLEIESRGYNINNIIDVSNSAEVQKISHLIMNNYGTENIYYQAALKGLFAHHSGISNGIKASIEYAMRKGYIKLIVCTSTLAQGVNLPIRYLVISTIYQGKDKIKVRDFHNLIGRAGRSGIYTEGSILLTESFIYNNRNNVHSKWKWNKYKELIDSNNSEPCSSSLLNLVKLKIEHGGKSHSINMKKIILSYYNDTDLFPEKLKKFLIKLKHDIPEFIDDFENGINLALDSLDAVESFLMSYLYADTWNECKETVDQIVTETLAYYLADNNEKKNLIELFEVIGKYCIDNISDSNQRYICSRSLLSVKKMIYIQNWVKSNIDNILCCKETSQLLRLLFSCIVAVIHNQTYDKLINADIEVLAIANNWIKGKTYYNILKECEKYNFTIMKRKKINPISLDDVVNICESVLSYDITVILSAISEAVKSLVDETDLVFNLFRYLGLELKYGIPYGNSVHIYELGFVDRVVSQKIGEFFANKFITFNSKYDAIESIKQYSEEVSQLVSEFPSYYINRLNAILRYLRST